MQRSIVVSWPFSKEVRLFAAHWLFFVPETSGTMAMNQFDPTEAMFGGITSIGGRMGLFFGALTLGHLLGMVAGCASGTDPFGLGFDGYSFLGALFLYIGIFFGHFFVWFGLIYIPLLATAFCLFTFSEITLRFLFPALLLVQLWDTCFPMIDWEMASAAWVFQCFWLLVFTLLGIALVFSSQIIAFVQMKRAAAQAAKGEGSAAP
ncbi:MAG: hypothetical protein QM796_15795 [Chthoniobacteraceae bacterium]